MADRRSLKKKAVETGKSVAGTLGEGARKIKDDAKSAVSKGDETYRVTQVQDKWVVVDSEGDVEGAFDDRENAEMLKRELQGGEEREMEPDEPDDVAEVEDDEPGKFQQFATGFANKVNSGLSKAAESVEAPDDEDMGEDRGPSLAFMGDASGEDRGTPMLPGMMGGQPEGEDEEQAQGPMLPGMMGGETEENGQAPSMPFMGGGMGGETDQPQLPFMGPQGESDDTEQQQGPQMNFLGGGMGNGPSAPWMGAERNTDDSERTEEEQMNEQPWMF